jgi:dihydrodipicolinate synthase/N-acetylneuraminate lyase
LKAALERLGFAGGAVRAPLPAANSEARASIAQLLEEAGVVEKGSERSGIEARRPAGALRQ